MSNTNHPDLTDEEVEQIMATHDAIIAAYHNRHKAAHARTFWEAVRKLKECNPDWSQEICEGFIYQEWSRYLATEASYNNLHRQQSPKPTTNKTADA